jgi:hypothetical protein
MIELMKKLPLFVCLTFLFLTGCTTDIGPAARKAGITALRPNPSLVVPPMRIGFESGTGNLSVRASEIILQGIYAKKLNRLANEMHEHHIDVPRMVRERVVQVLQQEKGFVMTNAADAMLAITIAQYGFGSSGLSQSKDVPFIAIKAKLLRGEEKIWSGEGQAHPLRSGGLGARVEEYHAQPQLLREHWEIQIDRAVRQLLTAKK